MCLYFYHIVGFQTYPGGYAYIYIIYIYTYMCTYTCTVFDEESEF